MILRKQGKIPFEASIFDKKDLSLDACGVFIQIANTENTRDFALENLYYMSSDSKQLTDSLIYELIHKGYLKIEQHENETYYIVSDDGGLNYDISNK